MKKIILTASLAVALLFNTKAQSVSYSTSLDDPYDVRALQIHLAPMYMDMSRAALLDLGWELWATADIKKRFRLMTSFRHTYLQLEKPTDVTQLVATKSMTPHTSSNLGKNWKFEAMGQFNFADYTRKKSVKIILSQYTSGYGSYRTTHTTYIMVPGTVRKSFGLRGGVYNMYVPLNLSETKGENDRSAFYGLKKGSTTDTIGFGGSTNGKYPSFSDVYTSMNSMVLAVGLDMRTVTNVVINTDSYGTRSNRQSNNVYLDALLAVYNNFRDVYRGDTAYDVKAYKKYPIGWRFGWQVTNPARTWLSMKFEFGKRPEWKSNTASGIFMDFNFGINIPVKIKKLED